MTDTPAPAPHHDNRLPDADLTVMVDRAAEGTWDAVHGAGSFRALPKGGQSPNQNAIRERMLPIIFHGTKALVDLGYVKPRVITTHAELESLQMVVIRSDAGTIANVVNGKIYCFGYENGVPVSVVALPATVLWERNT